VARSEAIGVTRAYSTPPSDLARSADVLGRTAVALSGALEVRGGSFEHGVTGISTTGGRYQIRLVRKLQQAATASGWKEGAGMPRDSGGQTAKSDGQHIGQADHRQQSSGKSRARMTRTREEALDQSATYEQERQDHAAKPQATGAKGAAGCRERIERRARWWRSGQRRKEEIQRRESVKCDPSSLEHGPKLRRRKRRREGADDL